MVNCCNFPNYYSLKPYTTTQQKLVKGAKGNKSIGFTVQTEPFLLTTLYYNIISSTMAEALLEAVDKAAGYEHRFRLLEKSWFL